ncbi:hypothetical protein Vadar_031548 [Vaccinium darrowii]|uniref:Uncharacterized protein n=1 Tax=Vaccinium darrowii TaxID=229202 RepID=A0ACB7YA43_9ERIC|nr:hypothetical protein Vadar_031548 [Vaccinium darrowii]
MERNGSESFTLFVDNLPVDVGILWFRNFFNRFGVVKDAFISSKRSKITNRRFGFIRYNCATSADMAISKAHGVWIENRKLFVKFAAFKDHRKEAAGGLKHIVIDSNRIGGRSYAEAVVGKKVGAPKCVIINDNPNEWLHRSAVAKLKSLATMEAIREAMHCEGIPEIEVKARYGRFVGGLNLPQCRAAARDF